MLLRIGQLSRAHRCVEQLSRRIGSTPSAIGGCSLLQARFASGKAAAKAEASKKLETAPEPSRTYSADALAGGANVSSEPREPIPQSSVPKGKVLSGLNILANGQDPVAMADEDYPPWVWKLTEPKQRTFKPEDRFSKVYFKVERKKRQLAWNSAKAK